MKKTGITTALFLLVFSIFMSCGDDEMPTPPKTGPYVLEHGSLPPPDIATDNPLTIEGVELGRRLFYEKALSKDGTMSCASCHAQANAFADTARFSTGVEGLKGKRQAMAVFNMAWNYNEFFWDGRAHLLRDQSLLPIQDPLEMNETLDNVIAKLKLMPDYVERFETVFDDGEITSENMSLAMEQFMNTIVSHRSKYDQFLAGQATLSPSEERGRKLFFDPFVPNDPASSGANCFFCHGGPNFENNDYMNNGLDAEANITDIGREEVTGSFYHNGAFKVPSLRNIELTFPYMHDGRFATLEEVIEHYNSGIQPSTALSSTLGSIQNNGGLALSQQDKSDLVAFLKTLTDHELIKDDRFSDPF